MGPVSQDIFSSRLCSAATSHLWAEMVSESLNPNIPCLQRSRTTSQTSCVPVILISSSQQSLHLLSSLLGQSCLLLSIIPIEHMYEQEQTLQVLGHSSRRLYFSHLAAQIATHVQALSLICISTNWLKRTKNYWRHNNQLVKIWWSGVQEKM